MRGTIGTPLGPVGLDGTEAITALHWGRAGTLTEGPLFDAAEEQIGAYFEGARRAFDLPLAHGTAGLTGRLLDALCAIPFGQTRTYGDLARELGAPAQAIGQACGANPLPLLIPCHRVLSARGLGGYSGAGGVETKVRLLRHEGAASLLL